MFKLVFGLVIIVLCLISPPLGIFVLAVTVFLAGGWKNPDGKSRWDFLFVQKNIYDKILTKYKILGGVVNV